MKKMLFILCASFLFTYCKKEEEIKGAEDNQQECIFPYNLYVIVPRNAPEYPYFMKNGQIDQDSIYFFRKVNGVEVDKKNRNKSINFSSHYSLIRDRDAIHMLYNIPDLTKLFTGQKETFYLKNRTKTYKIDVLGNYGMTERCGIYYQLKEAYVNDIKQADSITEKKYIKIW